MPESNYDANGDRWAALAALLAQDEAAVPDPEQSDGTLSAVLLLLYDKDGEPHVLLTRRTTLVASHKGEISLPGGAYEADRDPSLLHTALREATEEVGINPADLRTLGRLPTVHTFSSNYLIFPFVATAAQRPPLRADPFEVAEVLEVPLAVLRDPAALREEDWELHGVTQSILYYAYGEHKIWGATARILSEFLALLDDAALTTAQE